MTVTQGTGLRTGTRGSVSLNRNFRQVPRRMSLSCRLCLHGHPVLRQPLEMLCRRHDSLQIDQVTTHGKHDASLPLYDTPTSVSATHLAQLSPAESEELSGHLFRRMIPPKSTRRFIPAHRYPHHQQQNSLSER